MKRLLVCIVLLCLWGQGFAQGRISDHNTIGWYSTTITPKISEHISGHIEYQWRRTGIISNWQQSMVRLGVNYKLNPNLTVHAGYAYIDTYPYGEYFVAAVPKRFPEHRLYEQLGVNSSIGKVSLMHRLRIEQRWVGRLNSMTSNEADEFVYLNRVRYMPRVDIPVGDKWYAAMYDEIFIGFGENIGENIFDQNRVGIMIGYKAAKAFRLEAGFLNQTVQFGREISGKNVFQYNNGLVVNTYLNL